MVFSIDGDTPMRRAEAMNIAMILLHVYPGNPWDVTVYEGGVLIRHLDFPSSWGMNYNAFKSSDHFSASAWTKKLVMLAGEWLERANLSRQHAYDDETPAYRVEGVPDRDQPPEFKEPLNVVSIVDEHGMPIRSAPLRQEIPESELVIS